MEGVGTCGTHIHLKKNMPKSRGSARPTAFQHGMVEYVHHYLTRQAGGFTTRGVGNKAGHVPVPHKPTSKQGTFICGG